MILYNLYRKASKKSGRPETNSSKKNKKKWKTVNCLIYEIIRKRCYSLPLTRLQLTMTRFFSLIFETFHAQRLEFVDHSWSNQPRNQNSVSVWERWQFRYNAWSAGKREWPSRDWLFKLDLIGWQDGASFLEQSKRKVKQTQKETKLAIRLFTLTLGTEKLL